MTVNEFNEKYKEYLEPGFNGLELNHPEVIEYLDKKFQEFIKIPGFKYSQIILPKNTFSIYYFYCENVPSLECCQVEEKIRLIYKNK